MPEGVLAFLVLKLVQGDGGISVDGTVKFYSFTIYSARYNVAGESRRNALGDLKASHSLFVFTNGAVWKSNFNHNKLNNYLYLNDNCLQSYRKYMKRRMFANVFFKNHQHPIYPTP